MANGINSSRVSGMLRCCTGACAVETKSGCDVVVMTSCDVSSDVHSTFAGSIAEKKRCMKQIRYQKNTFNN